MDEFFQFLDNHKHWPPLFRYFMIRYFVLMDFVVNSRLLPSGEKVLWYMAQEEDPILKVNVYFMMKYLIVSQRFPVNILPEMDASVKASIINASGLNIWLPYFSNERLVNKNIAEKFLQDSSSLLKQVSYSTIARFLTTGERNKLCENMLYSKDMDARIGISHGVYSLIFDTAHSTEMFFREHFVFIEPYDRYLLEKRYRNYLMNLISLDPRLQTEIIKGLDYAIELYDGNAKLYYERAYIKVAQKRTDEAYQDMKKAMEIVPEYYRYVATMAILCYEMKNYQQAEKYADFVVEIEDNPYVLESMSELYREIAKFEKGKEVCKKLFANHPYEPKYSFLLIRYFCHSGERKEALLYLEWMKKNLQRRYQHTSNPSDILKKQHFTHYDFDIIRDSKIFQELPE